MQFQQCILLITAAFFLIILFRRIKKIYTLRKVLKMLPGPEPVNWILGNIPHLACADELIFQNLRKWAKLYFPLYRFSLGPTILVNVVRAEEVELIISSMQNLKKAPIYRMLHKWLRKGLLTSSGEVWQRRRKILTPSFHFYILKQFTNIFNKETDQLLKEFDVINENEPFDVMPYVTQLALRIINETAMGCKLNTNTKEGNVYKTAVNKIGKIYIYRMGRPWLWFNNIYYKFTNLGKKEEKLITTLQDFTNRVITEREQSKDNFSIKDNMAMLDLLLKAKKNNIIDDLGIREEVDTFMFEGHDTTSVALGFCFLILANYRQVQENIYNEIIEVLGDVNQTPDYNQLLKLKYMDRCIKEVLRLYPSVSFISRITDTEIVTKLGYVLPKKTIVNIHIYDLHRDESLFPDPEKFDPDRFLPENCMTRNPYAYIPFSAGPRNCIGQRFASLEIKAVLCGVLKKYILEAVDTPESIVLVQDLVLRSKYGIKIKFKKRL